KYKTLGRKPRFASAWGSRGDCIGRIADEKTIGEMDQLFAVVRLLLHRNDDPIGDDIVDVVGARGAGEAEIRDLNRGGTHGENSDPRARCVTVQIDEDPDFTLGHELRDVRITAIMHVNELVERRLQPASERAAVVRAERYREDLESRAVMKLEQSCGEIAYGMRAKIRGNVGDLYPA